MLLSLSINPISELQKEYISEIRKRVQDVLSSYSYPEYITCDVNILRFLRGNYVCHSLYLPNGSSILMLRQMPIGRCSFGERRRILMSILSEYKK